MMRNVSKHFHWALLASAAAAAGLAGCNTSSVPQLDWQPAPADTDTDAGATSAEGGEPGDGLPCAIADLLATRCQGFHSAHSSAPMSLVRYADLDAPSRGNPARKVRDLALERMGSISAPMPPSAPLGADDIAVFAAWLKEGAARATCGTGKGDGGTRDASGPKCALASDCPGALIRPRRRVRRRMRDRQGLPGHLDVRGDALSARRGRAGRRLDRHVRRAHEHRSLVDDHARRGCARHLQRDGVRRALRLLRARQRGLGAPVRGVVPSPAGIRERRRRGRYAAERLSSTAAG